MALQDAENGCLSEEPSEGDGEHGDSTGFCVLRGTVGCEAGGRSRRTTNSTS